MSRAASITNPTASPWNINEAAQSFNERFKSVIGLHDDGSGQRPPWMEKSGLWADTSADGKTINIWQYDGVRDILLWSVDVENGVTRIDSIQTAAAAALAAALAATPVGDIRMLPFRAEDLPARAPGWHCCNGGRYLLDSPRGRALYKLYDEESGPSNYALDWGITIDADNAINLPNMFHADGRGYFVRATNGTTRQVGTVEQDALQGVTGSVSYVVGGSANGAFAVTKAGVTAGSGTTTLWTATFDAGRVARTSAETRGLNIGMTPAIYLGV